MSWRAYELQSNFFNSAWHKDATRVSLRRSVGQENPDHLYCPTGTKHVPISPLPGEGADPSLIYPAQRTSPVEILLGCLLLWHFTPETFRKKRRNFSPQPKSGSEWKDNPLVKSTSFLACFSRSLLFPVLTSPHKTVRSVWTPMP